MKRTVPNRMLFAETRDQLLAGREVVVRVLGQSMLPFFRSGSRITLRPLREGDLRRGHVVLAKPTTAISSSTASSRSATSA